MIGTSWASALLAALALAGSAAADESIKLQTGELKTGMSYGEARELLVDEGWLPAGTCEGDAYMCNPAYPELDSCAGTGAAPCRFQWKAGEGVATKDGLGFIAVITEGERAKSVTGFDTEPPPQ